MSEEFIEFTEAVAKTSKVEALRGDKNFSKVTVLGGGADARIIAALCLSSGAEVALFSAYGTELEAMRTSSGINLRGEGPIGTFHVDKKSGPSILTTPEIDNAVKGAEIIFLTGPIHKQRTYAMVLANHLVDGQVIVIAPGRSLGALEASWLLRVGGCNVDITLVEIQGFPYWYQETGSVLNLTKSGLRPAATLPSGRIDVLKGLMKYLPSLDIYESILSSSFADGSAIIEFPALMMSGPAFSSGAIPVPMGGVPLPENATFASLIGEEQILLINKLLDERRNIASFFGVRDLPDNEWFINMYAGSIIGEGVRKVPSISEAKQLLRDGIIGSLVPLSSAAQIAGVKIPFTESLITIASGVLGADVASAGRRLDTVGIQSSDIEQVRRAMDSIAMGVK